MTGSLDIVLDIATDCESWQNLEGVERLAETALNAAIAGSGVTIPPQAEVSLLLCDDAFIRDLNRKWRGIDKPTNVLSFPGGPVGKKGALSPLLGDIVIAYETTFCEAQDEGKLPRDHFMHLMVHGVLHLVGYDHLIAAEAEKMETLERAILAGLGIDDPYLGALVQIAQP